MNVNMAKELSNVDEVAASKKKLKSWEKKRAAGMRINE